ncbi:MAG: NAD(P)(+) transhydrogenase (Re/Si-specific) subunit beta [Opitutales bacterium]|nr:NAD(P)(+) transhydrogenase (Re/Si-specific) subunit beta [Opitutales bacterium]
MNHLFLPELFTQKTIEAMNLAMTTEPGVLLNMVNLTYIVAAILFIFGLKLLGSARTAPRGNMISATGMLLAVGITLLDQQILSYTVLAIGVFLGATIGAVAAYKVRMTGMPEMVALFNGFGGMASLLVGWSEWHFLAGLPIAAMSQPLPFSQSVIALAVLIGGITFTGSLMAFLKLSGRISGRAVVFPGQKLINLAVATVIVGAMVAYVFIGQTGAAYPVFIGLLLLALTLGILGVLPIGGGDMPVVIALLNSLSGLAAAAAGFAIVNTVLIVAGCLVGASGLILTVIMCKAMNRSLGNVLFSGFGSAANSGPKGAVQGEMKPISCQDLYYVLESANRVVFIPGYGMAVAQAQHLVRELGEILEQNGTEICYAIHPVAGRMPGHMNVLLAEADVPYDQLQELAPINAAMEQTDVAVVIGANDVVNPAASDDPASPIYGMPIINAHKAKTVICLKRGQGAGFSGLKNELFFRENTRMYYGDAKSSIQNLVSEFKET